MSIRIKTVLLWILAAATLGLTAGNSAAQSTGPAAFAAKQKIRDQVLAAMDDGKITESERRNILSRAKEILSAKEYVGLVQTMDRLSPPDYPVPKDLGYTPVVDKQLMANFPAPNLSRLEKSKPGEAIANQSFVKEIMPDSSFVKELIPKRSFLKNLIPDQNQVAKETPSQRTYIVKEIITKQTVVTTTPGNQSVVKESAPAQTVVKTVVPAQTVVKQSAPAQTVVKESATNKQNVVKDTVPAKTVVKESIPARNAVKAASPIQTVVKELSSKQSVAKTSNPDAVTKAAHVTVIAPPPPQRKNNNATNPSPNVKTQKTAKPSDPAPPMPVVEQPRIRNTAADKPDNPVRQKKAEGPKLQTEAGNKAVIQQPAGLLRETEKTNSTRPYSDHSVPVLTTPAAAFLNDRNSIIQASFDQPLEPDCQNIIRQ
jgi:hypothetical protein